MALSGKRTTRRAPSLELGTHSVALGGLAAIALMLAINIGTGKIPVSNPTVSSQLPSSQLLTPSTTNIAEKPVVDPEAVPSRDEEPKPLQKQESKPQVNLSKDQIQEVQGWLRAYNLDPGAVDGIPGPKTFAAIRKFEAAHQRPETGNINYELVVALRLASSLPPK